MDRIDVLRLFVRVVETGSFSGVAKAEAIGQPTASKQVAALESRLGAQLLRRTSRGMSLTEAGEDFYQSAVRLLDDYDAAESRIGHRQNSPAGRIRVAMSAGFGRMHVLPRLPEFFSRYPEIVIETDVSDRHVNLVEERVDLAIRIGTLADSNLIARRIGTGEAAIVASPEYLARRGEPKTPEELADHDCVVFVAHGVPATWDIRTPAGPVAIEPRGRLYTNDAENIRASVLQGLGIARVPTWLFPDELDSGTVTRLFPAHALDTHSIYAVRASGRLMSSKVKVLIDFLADGFAEDPHLRVR